MRIKLYILSINLCLDRLNIIERHARLDMHQTIDMVKDIAHAMTINGNGRAGNTKRPNGSEI